MSEEGVRKVIVDGQTVEFRVQTPEKAAEKCHFCGLWSPVWLAQVRNYEVRACAQAFCQEQAVRGAKELRPVFDPPDYFGRGYR